MRLVRRLLVGFSVGLSLAAPAWAGQEVGPLAYGRHAIFGSSETFSADNSAFYKWTGMMQRFAAERRAARGVCRPGVWQDCEPAQWRMLVDELRPLDLRDKLERVNEAVNRYPYIPSQVNWGESNHWETPFEFFRKSGQCQDYAIAKYLLLREAGVPASALRLVVVRDTSLALDHAVTVALVDGEAWLLDNQIRSVVPVASVHRYQPYYSINEQGWWLHRGLNARYAANGR
jgi:predicted transglutaminase-like cysteine proteinase